MRSRADGAISLALLLTLAGCAAPDVSGPPMPSPATSPAGSGPITARPSPTLAPTPAPSAGIELPEPGRPFDAAGLLREMRESRRPGGVPTEVQTTRVAEAIAAALWTVDGSAWDTVAIAGYCGPASCTVELAGTRIGRAAEDLWVVEVDPAAASVTVVSAELRALPWDLVDELDALAREADGGGDLAPMLLTTVRWLPPPVGDRFVLSYRSGGEEGSCRRDVTLDATSGAIVDTVSSGC